jgi:hypothetical protein
VYDKKEPQFKYRGKGLWVKKALMLPTLYQRKQKSLNRIQALVGEYIHFSRGFASSPGITLSLAVSEAGLFSFSFNKCSSCRLPYGRPPERQDQGYGHDYLQ